MPPLRNNLVIISILLLSLGLLFPGLGYSSGSGSGSNSEREEFLRKFAKDPSVIKKDPAPVGTPENLESDHPDKRDNQKLETIIQNFRKSAVTVRPDASAATSGTRDKTSEDEEEGQAKGTVDMSAIKNLQGMMGSGDGKISPEELLKKMQASGMTIPGMPGATPGSSADYSVMVYQLLAPFRSQSEEQVTQIFVSKMQVGFFGTLFKVLPFTQKLPLIIARIARDESALPSVVKISSQRGKLLNYGLFVMLTFGLSFLLKRLRKSQDDSIFSGMKSGMLRGLIFTGLRFAVFFVLFSAEFSPLWQVIKKSF